MILRAGFGLLQLLGLLCLVNGYLRNYQEPAEEFSLRQIRDFLARNRDLRDLPNARFFNPFHYWSADSDGGRLISNRRSPSANYESESSQFSDYQKPSRNEEEEDRTANKNIVHLSRVDSAVGEVAPEPEPVFKTHSRQTRPVADQQPPVAEQHIQPQPVPNASEGSDVFFVALVAGCSAAAVVGVIAAGLCWYRFQKNSKATAEADYPAYGVTGPNREISPGSSGDRKLAQSAHMYHYQHQKQQMIALEKATEHRISTSDVDSDDENDEGDYTVYECPGLASTGEMEVKNPLFQDDPTPAMTPAPSKDLHSDH